MCKKPMNRTVRVPASPFAPLLHRTVSPFFLLNAGTDCGLIVYITPYQQKSARHYMRQPLVAMIVSAVILSACSVFVILGLMKWFAPVPTIHSVATPQCLATLYAPGNGGISGASLATDAKTLATASCTLVVNKWPWKVARLRLAVGHRILRVAQLAIRS